MRPLLILAALSAALASGCTVDQQNAVARESAKQAVRPVLARRFPGVPLEPATNCVIDNATASEIVSLAAAGMRGQPDQRTADTVIAIVQRPGTIECLATDGLPVLLGGLQTRR